MCGKPRGMRQQMADRDAPAPFRIRARIPLGNVARHGQIECESPGFHLHGNERRGDDGLRERRGIVNRVWSNDGGACVVGLPAKRMHLQFSAISDCQDAAGKGMVGDRAIQDVEGWLQLRVSRCACKRAASWDLQGDQVPRQSPLRRECSPADARRCLLGQTMRDPRPTARHRRC